VTVLWFTLLMLGIILFIALLPPWPHMRHREWGYGPSGVALGLIALLLLLWWGGLIAFWWPWYAA
jgi:hypothetical protein